MRKKTFLMILAAMMMAVMVSGCHSRVINETKVERCLR